MSKYIVLGVNGHLKDKVLGKFECNRLAESMADKYNKEDVINVIIYETYVRRNRYGAPVEYAGVHRDEKFYPAPTESEINGESE